MSTRADVQSLLEAGCSVPEAARRLGLAPPTVAYHAARIRQEDEAPGPPASVAPDPSDHRNATHSTRARIASLLAAGVTRAEAARQLGLSKATVSYHARRLGDTVDAACARRYDWDAVQRHYDAGHTVRECMERFGFSSASWYQAMRRGSIAARPSRAPIADLLTVGTYRGRFHLKARLLEEGLKTDRCERCGLSQWQGRSITLALHHVNGVRDDNRLENLQLLCPNCHSQTENFAGRNRAPPAAADAR